MNHDVFISYSSKNRSAATEVCNALEENGVRCWIAPRNITAGAQYGDLIEDAIKTCKVVVVLFSESAAASQWVSGELNVAFEENKTIIPLRLDQTPLKGQNRVMLNQRHWIDGSADYRAKFTDLVLAVTQATGKQETADYESFPQQPQATVSQHSPAPAVATPTPKTSAHTTAAAPMPKTSAHATAAAPMPKASASNAAPTSQHKQFSGPVELKYGRTAKSVMNKHSVTISASRPVSASGQPLRSAQPVTGTRTATVTPHTTGNRMQNQANMAVARQQHMQQHKEATPVGTQQKQESAALWKILVPIAAGVILIAAAILAFVL